MKRFFSLFLIVTLLASALSVLAFAEDRTVTTADPNAALDEFLNLPDWPIDENEESERKEETIYPEEFAGMYAAEDGSLVVCVTEDTPEIEEYYRAMLPNIGNISFRTVQFDYNTLQHFMLVIEQRHVSSNLLVVNMYKIKDYYINYQENRIDIRMYTDLEYDTIEYLHGIFGDAIYISFCDTTGEVDWYDEDYVRERQAGLDAETAAAEAEAAAQPEVTFADEVSQKAEETGFSVRTVVIPVVIVAVVVLVFFGYSKLRSRKTNFSEDEEDYIDK